MSSERMRIVAAGTTHVGEQREANEDAFLSYPERGLFVVADGMGGPSVGNVASALVVETIRDAFRTREHEATAEDLLAAIRIANRRIWDRRLNGGATVVAALFDLERQHIDVANVNDCRCYRLRDGSLRQLTEVRPHHHVHIRSLDGLSPAEVADIVGPPPDVRAVGLEDDVQIDLHREDVRAGDTYVLCSDGLTAMVAESDIQQILEDMHDLDEACKRLVDLANEHGGEDNITILLVRLDAL